MHLSASPAGGLNFFIILPSTKTNGNEIVGKLVSMRIIASNLNYGLRLDMPSRGLEAAGLKIDIGAKSWRRTSTYLATLPLSMHQYNGVDGWVRLECTLCGCRIEGVNVTLILYILYGSFEPFALLAPIWLKHSLGPFLLPCSAQTSPLRHLFLHAMPNSSQGGCVCRPFFCVLVLY